MAKSKHTNVLLASSDVMALMPHEKVTSFVAELDAYHIELVQVDSNVDTGKQVDDVPSSRRIVGFIGHSENDIPGLAAAINRDGLAISVGGPASLWCARKDGQSVRSGRYLEVRQPSDAILAIQSAVGGG